MPVLLIARTFPLEVIDHWRQALLAVLGDEKLYLWTEEFSTKDIEYVAVWGNEPGELAQFENLKIIFSLGAGVEHLLNDPDLPANIPIVRLLDDGLVKAMNEYVLMRALHYHRRMHEYHALQAKRIWRELPYIAPEQRCVGVLGLGQLGSSAALMLAQLGFNVIGWSRSPKALPAIETVFGQDGLDKVLANAEVLINLLPLTPETEGLLSSKVFAKLGQKPCLINVGRGGHVNEQDLLVALDEGKIAHASLDVFQEEPLPETHPFWTHPKITITPHYSASSPPTSTAQFIAENIHRHRQGETLSGLVDRARGY